MRRWTLGLEGAATLLLCGCLGAMSAPQPASKGPRPLKEFEAMLLVSLVPDVQEVASKGYEVRFGEGGGGEGFNEAVYYGYRVVGETTAPSGLIGHYAVNKYTTEVWDFVLRERITSPDLQLVQEIMKRTHALEAAIVRKYQDEPFYRDGPH